MQPHIDFVSPKVFCMFSRFFFLVLSEWVKIVRFHGACCYIPLQTIRLNIYWETPVKIFVQLVICLQCHKFMFPVLVTTSTTKYYIVSFGKCEHFPG